MFERAVDNSRRTALLAFVMQFPHSHLGGYTHAGSPAADGANRAFHMQDIRAAGHAPALDSYEIEGMLGNDERVAYQLIPTR